MIVDDASTALGPTAGWFDRLAAAREALKALTYRTPILTAESLDTAAGARLFFKAECLQITGSFKVRGMLRHVGLLSGPRLERGLLTVSSGNAALGAAYAAREFRTNLTVVMASGSLPLKVDRLRAMGVAIHTEGVTDAMSAFRVASELCEEKGFTFVHPFDTAEVITGAATATAELLDDVPDLDAIVVPTSGGSLMSGAAMAIESYRLRKIQLFGIQPEGADAIARSVRAGRPLSTAKVHTIADALTAQRPGVLTFPLIMKYATDVLTVPDSALLSAMRLAATQMRVVVEPGGAAALAGVLQHMANRRAKIGVVLSGGNAEPSLLAQVLRTE